MLAVRFYKTAVCILVPTFSERKMAQPCTILGFVWCFHNIRILPQWVSKALLLFHAASEDHDRLV